MPKNQIDGTLNTCESILENKIFREEYPFVTNLLFCQLKLINLIYYVEKWKMFVR